MANIKVTYDQVSRRFTVSPTTTWSAFESHLRSLFKIPTSTPITISYTDEDGDVITLSSDLELLEVLSPTREFDNGKSKNGDSVLLRFVLTVPSDENMELDSNSWMFEGSTVHKEDGRVNSINNNDNESSDEENYNNHVIYNDSEDSSGDSGEDDQVGNFSEGTPLIELNENNKQVSINKENKQVLNNEEHASKRNHVTLSEEAEEPTFEPTISSGHGSQGENLYQKEPDVSQHETIGETSSSSFSPPPSFSPNSNSHAKQNDDQPPKVHDKEEQNPEEDEYLDNLEDNLIVLIPQLQRLPFFGPRFLPFAHPFFSRHTRFSHCRHSPHGDEYGPFSRLGTYRHRRQCIIGSIFKKIIKAIIMISLFITLVKFFFIAFCPFITIYLLWKGLTYVNSFHHGRGYNERWGRNYHRHFCRDEINGEECEGSGGESRWNGFGYSRRPFSNQRCGTCCRSPNDHNIPETDIKENLKILKSMGFNVNERKLEELVKRYNGNMNRVIDRLLGQ